MIKKMKDLTYSNGKRLEIEKIKAIEVIIGITLPKTYVEMMEINNGCEVYPFKFKDKDNKYDMINNFLVYQ